MSVPNIDYTQANIDLVTDHAKDGNADAQAELGYRFFYGEQGVEQSFVKAEELFWEAHSQGSLRASYNLGVMILGVRADKNSLKTDFYLSNTDFDKNDAFDLIKSAAERGYDHAQYKLALTYYYGLQPLDRRDTYKSFEWYEKAANQGHAKAMVKLACFYDSGWKRGLEKDTGKALDLLETALENGCFDAVFWLRIIRDARMRCYSVEERSKMNMNFKQHAMYRINEFLDGVKFSSRAIQILARFYDHEINNLSDSELSSLSVKDNLVYQIR